MTSLYREKTKDVYAQRTGRIHAVTLPAASETSQTPGLPSSASFPAHLFLSLPSCLLTLPTVSPPPKKPPLYACFPNLVPYFGYSI